VRPKPPRARLANNPYDPQVLTDRPACDVARAKAKLIMDLGECKIDLMHDAPNLSKRPIHQIARDQGIEL
jgi:hypothetical protein